jgi:hypothetical protein
MNVADSTEIRSRKKEKIRAEGGGNIIYYIITMTSIPVMKEVSKSIKKVMEETPHTYARTLTVYVKGQ